MMKDHWTVFALSRKLSDTQREVADLALRKSGLPPRQDFPFTDEGLAEAESLRAKVDKVLKLYGFPLAVVQKVSK